MKNEFNGTKIFELLKDKTRDLSPLMNSIAQTMRISIMKNFESEGSRIGKSWSKLSHKTIKERTRKGYWPGKILQRTGQLKRSIQPSSGIDYAQVSTNLIYAAIQNYGGIVHRTSLKTYLRKKRENKQVKDYKGINKMSSFKIPARPFLLLSDADYDKIKKEVINYLIK